MNAFPSPSDIVTRLRDYRSHRIHMQFPDRDGILPERVDWNLTGAEPNTLMVEAADTIEHLRNERDEARRLAIAHQVDLQRASAGKLYESEWEAKFRIAKERGWDCFEQDN
jgi:hypothetical protein